MSDRDTTTMDSRTLERFFAKVEKTDTCWLWTAGRSQGYGNFAIISTRPTKFDYAHRVIYQHVWGPIPEGLEIDHLCRVRRCVNPAHLEAVTRRVNQRRGFSVSGLNARKTHCHRGHPFDAENTRRSAQDVRVCRTCELERGRAKSARWLAAGLTTEGKPRQRRSKYTL